MNEQAQQELAAALFELGFSQYEAKCYVGLISQTPRTGYRVAKNTGVPQPKVYETLRRLVARGVVTEIPGDPTLYSAIPPSHLFETLKSGFDERLSDAKRLADELSKQGTPRPIEHVERLLGEDDVITSASGLIAGAGQQICVQANGGDLEKLTRDLRTAARRGVDLIVFVLDSTEVELPSARILRYRTRNDPGQTGGRRRQLSLVADSESALQALGDGHGGEWYGVLTGSPPIVAAVESSIQRAVEMQHVLDDFAAELAAAYGPGLEGLTTH